MVPFYAGAVGRHPGEAVSLFVALCRLDSASCRFDGTSYDLDRTLL